MTPLTELPPSSTTETRYGGPGSSVTSSRVDRIHVFVVRLKYGQRVRAVLQLRDGSLIALGKTQNIGNSVLPIVLDAYRMMAVGMRASFEIERDDHPTSEA